MKSKQPVESGGADNLPLESVIDEAIEAAHGDRASIRDLLKEWGDRSYGPLFIVLGFVAGTPISGVPGLSAIIGVVIAILAAQMAAGRHHAWLPGFVLNFSIKAKALRGLRRRFDPVLSFLDNLVTERLGWAAGEWARRAAAAIVFVLGLLMIPFDAIPFAVTAPALAVVPFGVAITARDGLVMLLAFAGFLAVGWLGLSLV